MIRPNAARPPAPAPTPGTARATARTLATCALAALILSACAPGPTGPAVPAPFETLPEDSRSDAPPRTARAPSDPCTATAPIPAIYGMVMGEIQVIQADIAPDGTVLRPPIYRRTEVPRVLRPRGELRFDAVCEDRLTEAFVASLQRALTARGLYAGPVTGQQDAPTRDAIRRFQRDRGLNADRLSVESARALGLIAVDTPR